MINKPSPASRDALCELFVLTLVIVFFSLFLDKYQAKKGCVPFFKNVRIDFQILKKQSEINRFDISILIGSCSF